MDTWAGLEDGSKVNLYPPLPTDMNVYIREAGSGAGCRVYSKVRRLIGWRCLPYCDCRWVKNDLATWAVLKATFNLRQYYKRTGDFWTKLTIG